MSTPAGRPWRVITISSCAARRRYFERSSFTSANATAWPWCAVVREPSLRLACGDDGKDLDRRFCNVIEHPDVTDAQSVLRLAKPAQTLNATLTDLRWLVSEVTVDAVPHEGALAARQTSKHTHRFRRHNDRERHVWLDDS